jgi:type I restriction enzyme S subunit
VEWAEVERWDPCSYHTLNWKWPAQTLRPLGSALHARKEKVNRSNTPFSTLQPVTVHFDGSISRREVAAGREYSMELWHARPGDFIVAKIDLKNGAVGIVPSNWENVAVTGHFAVYEPDRTKVSPLYLHLLIQAPFFKNLLWRNKVGAEGRKEVKLEFFESIPIPLPSLAHQQTTVAAWQKSQAEIAAARARADVIEAKAKQAFLAALGLREPGAATARKAFALDFARLERWGVAQLRESLTAPDVATGKYPVAKLGEVIADLENGWSPKCFPRPATADEWGVLKLGAITGGAFDELENKALPPSFSPKSKLEVRKGDVLITRGSGSGALVASCVLVESTRPKLMISDLVFRAVLRTPSSVSAPYLVEILRSKLIRSQIETPAGGASTTMKKVTKGGLLALRLPLPPLAVQRELVKAMQAARAEAARERATADALAAHAATELEARLLGETVS